MPNFTVSKMNDLIFAEELISESACTYCHKYLSVGPVMSPSDGHLICGRCSKDVDCAGCKSSLFNLVAEKMIFRCLHYYSGCKKLLFFNEATEHERTCNKKPLRCPFCDYSSNGCELYNHFTKKHPRWISRSSFPPLIILDNILKKIIYTKRQSILCLNIHVGEKVVQIFNCLVTWDNVESRCDFKLKFYEEEGFIETPMICVNGNPDKLYLETDLSAQINAPSGDVIYRAMMNDCFPSGSCKCQVLLIDAEYTANSAFKAYIASLVQEVDNLLSSGLWEVQAPKISREPEFYVDFIANIDLSTLKEIIECLDAFQICGYCNRYITTTVYVCSRYHLACKDCAKRKCAGCRQFCVWNSKSKLHSVTLPCHWEDCDTMPNFFEYTKHKRACRFRRYECPGAECPFVGCLDCLKNHWHIGSLVYDSDVQVQPKYSTYWLIENELYRVASDYIDVEMSSWCSSLIVGVTAVDVMLQGVEFDLYELYPVGQESQRLIVPFVSYPAEKRGRATYYFQITNTNIQSCYLCLKKFPVDSKAQGQEQLLP